MYRTTGFQSASYPNFTPKLSPQQQRVGNNYSTGEQLLVAFLKTQEAGIPNLSSIADVSGCITEIIEMEAKHLQGQRLHKPAYKIPSSIKKIKDRIMILLDEKKQALLHS